MTNYIVNKTTTEVFAVVADSMIAATKMVEQENGVAMNVSVAYNARLQTAAPAAAPQMGFPQIRPMPLPPKVASKK